MPASLGLFSACCVLTWAILGLSSTALGCRWLVLGCPEPVLICIVPVLCFLRFAVDLFSAAVLDRLACLGPALAYSEPIPGQSWT